VRLFLALLATYFSFGSSSFAQQPPYIGFVYPAGGRQGTTFQVRLGGQALDELDSVRVTGPGVTARLTEYRWRLNFQEMRLLNEQLRILRREGISGAALAGLLAEGDSKTNAAGSNNAPLTEGQAAEARKAAAQKLMEAIERRTAEFVPNPACASLASIALVEVSIAPDAEPGEREIRLVTRRAISNPLPFYVGQLPEFSRPPMRTAPKQVLGKEADALRKGLPGDQEMRVSIPCTVNGQSASGEVNRYRFQARRGQRLVLTTLGRRLVPFIADAVPGWFQPVLTLSDSEGKEVAYDDDYRFKPDPTIYYEVPHDGEYVAEIHDSLYRGREDFVYRLTIGELPFITSIFPLGERLGAGSKPKLTGWNLEGAGLGPMPAPAAPQTCSLAADRKGLLSNHVPFAFDTLPETMEQEPNNTPEQAQRVILPLIINGRIDRPSDWDVFEFAGKSNETVVAEVEARRLDSPLDSLLKLTDGAGNLLAFNDDHEELACGLNTHQADSYLRVRLPADGEYFVHIGDTARHGGQEFGYRLRLSEPRPDFLLRVVPSSLSFRSRSAAALTVYGQRKDGFTGPIKVSLKDPPPGFSSVPLILSGTQTVARLTVRTTLPSTAEPVTLSVVGTAYAGAQEITHTALAAEDRMQAFLWRHLVPAKDLVALVFNPADRPPPKRVPRPRRPAAIAAPSSSLANSLAVTNAGAATNAPGVAVKPRFTEQQVARQLRMLRRLFDQGLLTDDFYNQKAAELEAGE
jgi:hypothetical protein